MPKESLENKKKRSSKILNLLKKHYPDAKCALIFKTPLDLLIATQLSAQCTDVRVNKVTKDLFIKYKTAKDYADAQLSQLEKMVFSTGFYKNKAKNIKKTGQKLEREYQGEIPKKLEDLVSLNGVGRKTAHVVLGTAFNIPSGIVVDTHVKRLSYRMNLSSTLNVLKSEKQLETIIQKKYWISFSHYFIEHGRQICSARKPKCEKCFLYKLCPKKDVA